MPKPNLITCQQCKGQGRVELPEHLEQTLQKLRRMKSATALQIGEALAWKSTRSAMNRRLEELRGLGFVKRERIGRDFLYSPTEIQ
jgi:hypothetical protein